MQLAGLLDRQDTIRWAWGDLEDDTALNLNMNCLLIDLVHERRNVRFFELIIQQQIQPGQQEPHFLSQSLQQVQIRAT